MSRLLTPQEVAIACLESGAYCFVGWVATGDGVHLDLILAQAGHEAYCPVVTVSAVTGSNFPYVVRLCQKWRDVMSDPVGLMSIATGGVWPTVEVP